MSEIRLDPELASEVAARLHAALPELRILFSIDDLAGLSGHDVEELAQAIYLIGYGQGLEAAVGVREGQVSEILRWAAARSEG